MGIKLRSFDIGVAEHRLEAAKVRATLEQMGGEGMAQYVRAQLAKDTSRFSVIP